MADETEDTTFVCALSGKAAKTTDLALDADDEDPLGDMPVGWIRVLLSRRMPNPDWLRLQQTKEATITGQISQLAQQIPKDTPPDAIRAAEEHIRVLADVQFHSIEEDTPRYVVVEQAVHIADPTRDPSIAEAWKGIGGALGIALS
jgi:hypothetical protein